MKSVDNICVGSLGMNPTRTSNLRDLNDTNTDSHKFQVLRTSIPACTRLIGYQFYAVSRLVTIIS